MPAVRGVEFARATRGGRARARSRRARRAQDSQCGADERGNATRYWTGRAGPCSRWGHRGGVRYAARRRSGHWQVHAAAAGRTHIAGSHRVIYASGEESVSQVGARARRLSVGANDLAVVTENDLDSDPGIGGRPQRYAAGGRLHPDRCAVQHHHERGCGGAVARMHGGAGTVRQVQRHGRDAHRARHQGGHDRRAAHAGASGRHGSVLRKRGGQPLIASCAPRRTASGRSTSWGSSP